MSRCHGVVEYQSRCTAAAYVVEHRVASSGFKGKLRRTSDRYGFREYDLNYDRRARFVGTVAGA